MVESQSLRQSQSKTHSNILCSFRFLLIVLLFFAFILIFAQRTNMSIGIICMINHTAIDQKQHLLLVDELANTKIELNNNATESLVKCALDLENDLINATSSTMVYF
jgi:ABC-type uncharacterized transport system substrate-binding protein